MLRLFHGCASFGSHISDAYSCPEAAPAVGVFENGQRYCPVFIGSFCYAVAGTSSLSDCEGMLCMSDGLEIAATCMIRCACESRVKVEQRPLSSAADAI